MQIKNNFTNDEKLGVFSPLILLPLGPTNLNYELIFVKDFHLLSTKNRMGGAFQVKSWQFRYFERLLTTMRNFECRAGTLTCPAWFASTFFFYCKYIRIFMYILNVKHIATNLVLKIILQAKIKLYSSLSIIIQNFRNAKRKSILIFTH